ncbi:nitrite reductase (NAD(P)H) small subunit [Caballeronia catudaia]|uniref:Nitrite reductase (NAD(P)H) small subunit n=1 Tax=Caballeronia catudaia TaxID=1777136 RepID=A0A158A249_9BURK|nr:nitrite reductase small subunit NirD [Caballeronia catudaia]SAK51157.1 nitrite reductase (NAD(P)H) small subunit [Caballeronia catudaia]
MNDRIEQDWTAVCEIDDIVPDTGVCALVKGTQVAVFHLAGEDAALYAIDNYDPHSQAAVLSRGIVGSMGERIVVASPIYKQHFDLRTGECLEAPEFSVNAYRVRVAGGKVWVAA